MRVVCIGVFYIGIVLKVNANSLPLGYQANEWFDAELTRVERYMDDKTRPRIKEVLEKELIITHIKRIIEVKQQLLYILDLCTLGPYHKSDEFAIFAARIDRVMHIDGCEDKPH